MKSDEFKYLGTRILIVEDFPSDAELNEREIRSVLKECTFKRVDSEYDFIAALNDFKPDIIVSDYKMPSFNGLSALNFTLEITPLTPFIMVTGSQNEDTAVECMKAGATDYIIKGHYKRLGAAVLNALEQKEIKLEKEKNKKNLLESEERLRLALAAANQGMFDLNIQTGVTIVSPEYATMLGYDPVSFIETNESWTNRLHPDDKDRAFTFYHDYIDGRVPSYLVEYRQMTKSGHWKWILSSGKIVAWDKDGKPLRMLGTHTDITRQKFVEDELKRAWVSAEEADRLKAAFLHNISHEIRTPMNAIVGFSNLLKQEDLNIDKKLHYIDIICMSSNQLLSIITDLISIATIEAGQEKLKESETNLNKLFQSLYLLFEDKVDKSNVSFSFNAPFTSINTAVIVDETKLNQVLSNLIGNAIKFTKEGRIQFGCDLTENTLKFYVFDTGIGIPSEFHAEIFERFRQADNGLLRTYGGTGLGLAISKAYVELMGGKIWLQSIPSKGSEFYFTIPYKPVKIEKADDVEILSYNRKLNSLPKRILIAEDEDFNFMLIEELLIGLNFTLFRAKNGLEAVEKCKNDPDFDMIFMDIKMPILSGYEAARQIKIFRPRLPIIALTAYAHPNDKETALSSGCDDYIPKPIVYDHLYSILIKYFERQPA